MSDINPTRRTDGERIAGKTARSPHEKWGMVFAANLAAEIDRLVRRRMAEAWDQGWTCAYEKGHPPKNPYRGRTNK